MKSDAGSGIENTIRSQVNALYELMKSEKLEELEIKESTYYLYLKRKGRTSLAAPAPAGVPAVVPAVPEPSAEPAAPAGQTVRSPITGVFYRAPSPALPPFVKEGDVVDAGRTLCIVEAMKVMNEIKADTRLKILGILVENGKPVNAAQDLFVVEKA